MRQLNFNFSGHLSLLQQAGKIFLLLSVVLAAYCVWKYEETEQELSVIRAHQSKLARVQSDASATRQNAEVLSAKDEEIKYANRVIDRLALPWDRLFNEMENTVDADVVLLDVAPDAERGRISFTSETRDLSTMLNYERRLAQSPLLRDVVIQSHQVQIQDPQKPVRFVVAADWLRKTQEQLP
ncbi:PilN domain-containing protein [Duganella radicis]|uniref:Fimbrial assembly protein n=1 Tax=Duganella radicis TaxID=551988 RepID=A0A6L6PPG8_9BURK|nr:PilN domain-containing protein [Duganella radicis]MTV40557.1 hypothetical protein [Duganella radicis]